jgi:hypothetical protein
VRGEVDGVGEAPRGEALAVLLTGVQRERGGEMSVTEKRCAE